MWDNPHSWENKYPETGLPPWAVTFAHWLILPSWERGPEDPKNQAEFSRAHGIQQTDLSRIKKHDRFREYMQKQSDNFNLSPERIQEVMNAIFGAAKGGDMKAATLYLQHADKLAPRRVEIVDNRLEKISDEELRELLSTELRP